MSTVGTALNDCPAIQYELDQYYNTCNAAERADVSPLVRFLYSAENTQRVQQVVVDAPGKVKTIQFRYDQIIAESEVTDVDSCDRDCTATTKRGDLYHQVTIDPCVKKVVEGKMEAKDFYYSCLRAPERIDRLIRNMMSALRRATQTKLVHETIGLAGPWSSTANTTFTPAGGGSPDIVADRLRIKTKVDGTQNPYPSTLVDIDLAFQMNGFCSPPAIFTGAELYRYLRLMQNGCCSQNGVDLGAIMAQYGYAAQWDRRVQIDYGVGGALALQPGSMQIIEFNEYEVDPEIEAALQASGYRNYDTRVLYDPLTGMGMNFLFSDNCGVISIIAHTVTKITVLPADLFPAGDFMDGINWVNELEVVNV